MNNSKVISATVQYAVALMILTGLAACTKKVYKLSTESSIVDPAPSVDQALDAVLRSHPESFKACYETKYNGYFVYYGPVSNDASDISGWIFIKNINFNFSSNNTYFTIEQPDKDYMVVFPDVTGLPCKEQTHG